MTQANPLLAYAQTRSAESFAAVIQQYQRFVFATCRRKLHDPADLDDAVQETFLRLAQKAGELHSNIGGWLHRCAVNVALDLNRRRETRKRHEATAASYRHEPIGDAQGALAELREQLDAALEKLSDDQRELIVQRYFVGRPPSELAAAVGVTPSAITHRIDRAIEALRGHLNQAGFSPAVAVGGTAAVARLLDAESASAAVPANLTANLMKIGLSGVRSGAAATVEIGILAKIIIGIAATLIMSCGVWLAMSGQVAPPVSMPTTAPLVQAAVAPPTTLPTAFTVRGISNDPAVQPPQWQATSQPADLQRAVLSGRVMDRQGKPVVGAQVFAHITDGTSMASEATAVAQTDAQGIYHFDAIKDPGGYRIGIDAAGYVSLDAYGQPNIEINALSHARRDFVIERGVDVTVNVMNSAGQPVRGADVDVVLPGDPMRDSVRNRKQADELGQVHTVIPASKTAYLAAASMNGYAAVHQMITPESPDKPIEIGLVLLRGINVSGVAICNDGKPATGWGIYAKPDWWSLNMYPSRSVPIDAEGNFMLKNVSPGTYAIYLSKRDRSYQIATATLPLTDGQPLKVNVPESSPRPLEKLSGRVTFVGGKQPDFVEVEMIGIGGLDQLYFTQIRPFATRRGQALNTFTINDVVPGSYRISFQARELETKIIERFDVPGELPEIELKILGGSRITGTVVDGSTGQPIPQFAFRIKKVRTLGNSPNYVQETRWTQAGNPQGTFSADLVGPGVYRVQASADGYAWSWSSDVSIEGGKSGDISMHLTAGGALRGRVMDPDGKPVSAAKIVALSMAKNVVGNRDRFSSDAGAVTSNEQGYFTLLHLAAGVETIKLSHKDFASTVIANLKIVENQTADVGEIKLPIGGTAEGTVYDNKGEPLAGQPINFQDDFGYNGDEMDGRLATTVSDDKGHFKVEHLPLQPIWINTANGYQRDGIWRRTIFPVDGKTAQIDFGGAIPVTGKLLSLKREPIANRRLELSTSTPYFAPVSANATTDMDGRFSFQGVPPGRYSLRCESEPRTSESAVLRNNIEVFPKGADLGDVVYDVGDVTIIVSADDPADVKALRYLSVETDIPESDYQQQISRAGPEGKSENSWIASNVPAGRYRVNLAIGSDYSTTLYASFERKAEADATRVEIRLPKPAATLRVRVAKPTTVPAALIIQGGQPLWSRFVSLMTSNVQDLKIPAGTYSFIDRMTMRPRTDIAPVTLAADESRDIEINASDSTAINPPRVMVIRTWDPTGVLIAGTTQITDQSGKVIPPMRENELGVVYVLAPGHYQAAVDWPGSPPSRMEFDVPVTSDSNAIDLVKK